MQRGDRAERERGKEVRVKEGPRGVSKEGQVAVESGGREGIQRETRTGWGIDGYRDRVVELGRGAEAGR